MALAGRPDMSLEDRGGVQGGRAGGRGMAFGSAGELKPEWLIRTLVAGDAVGCWVTGTR